MRAVSLYKNGIVQPRQSEKLDKREEQEQRGGPPEESRKSPHRSADSQRSRIHPLKQPHP